MVFSGNGCLVIRSPLVLHRSLRHGARVVATTNRFVNIDLQFYHYINAVRPVTGSWSFFFTFLGW